jgi:hypothetical protein
MIPIDSGSLRDLLIASVIVASLYGLIRFFHDYDEVWSAVEIHQHLNLGGNEGKAAGYRVIHHAAMQGPSPNISPTTHREGRRIS